MNTCCTAWLPRLLSVLRLVSAYMVLTHGSAKLLHIPHIPRYDNLQLYSLMGVAGTLELIFGALLLIGLFSRSSAFILSGFTAAAYFIGHASQGHFFLPLMNGGEAAILYCFVFLYLSAAGPGPWSIDALRKK